MGMAVWGEENEVASGVDGRDRDGESTEEGEKRYRRDKKMHEGLTKVVGACLPIYILVRLRGNEEGEGGSPQGKSVAGLTKGVCK